MWKGTLPKKHKIDGGGGKEGLVATIIVAALDNGGWRDSEGGDGTVRAPEDGDDLPGASTAIGSSDGNNNSRWGRTLTGKGQEPAATTTAGKGGHWCPDMSAKF
jgi:hypothetical protein